jgi:hypothetical protein
MNPPRKRKITGLAKGAAASFTGATPSNGNKTSGNNAVTGIGIASVIHKTAITPTTPAVRHAATLNPSGGSVISTRANKTGATSNPTRPAALIPLSRMPAPCPIQSLPRKVDRDVPVAFSPGRVA